MHNSITRVCGHPVCASCRDQLKSPEAQTEDADKSSEENSGGSLQENDDKFQENDDEQEKGNKSSREQR